MKFWENLVKIYLILNGLRKVNNMKKKVIFINGHMNVGGIEKILLDILKNIDYSKYSIDLCLLEEGGDYYKEIPKNVNVKILSMKDMYGSFIESLIRCVKKKNWNCFIIRILIALKPFFKNKVYKIIKYIIFKNKKYDYAIATRTGYSAEIIAYSNISRNKSIWWHHGDFGLNTVEDTKKILTRFNKIIAVSSAINDYLKTNIPEISTKLVVVENGIDIKRIETLSKEYNPYIKYKNKFIICSVGRINPEKRYDIVVKVADYLKNTLMFDFVWFIVGDGIEKEKIKKMIEEYNLTSEIILIGNTLNPYVYIKNANVFVHTSDVESFGIVILESMLLKTLCIVRSSLGPQSYMKTGVNGILINGDFKEIAHCLVNIRKNKNFDILIENAYLLASEYSIQNMVRKFERNVFIENV